MFECERELETDSGCNSAWNLLHLTPEITKSAGTKQKLIATWPAITKRFPPRILMLNTLQLLDCLGNLARLIQSELIRMWAQCLELHLLKFYLTSLLRVRDAPPEVTGWQRQMPDWTRPAKSTPTADTFLESWKDGRGWGRWERTGGAPWRDRVTGWGQSSREYRIDETRTEEKQSAVTSS